MLHVSLLHAPTFSKHDMPPSSTDRNLQPFMLQPLFTYPIQGTTWFIIVAEGASHFYFNSKTGVSVWQISETGIDDFASKVDFDDLAVLFAKANGFRIGVPEKNEKKRKSLERGSDLKRRETENALGCKDQVEADKAAEIEPSENTTRDKSDVDEGASTKRILDHQVVDEEEDDPNSGDISKAQNEHQGLDLGYSSTEDDNDSVEENENLTSESIAASSSHEALSESDEGVNSGLDLAFESDDDASGNDDSSKQDFISLLEELKGDISIYDPWFLVEEELLPKFSQRSAYYGLSDPKAREHAFDEWVASKVSEKQSNKTMDGKFPTQKLRFLRYLQDFKAEVRQMYFLDFCKKHSAEIDALSAELSEIKLEQVYRELRVTLNDYADSEKAEKKEGTKGNLKVAHVEAYLRRKLVGHTLPREMFGSEEGENMDFFDRWINLCNKLDLPEHIVCDTTNFILGDEKRLASYLRVLEANRPSCI